MTIFHFVCREGFSMRKRMRIFKWDTLSLTWIILFLYLKQAVFVFVLQDTERSHFGDYKFPMWADSLGWLVGASTLAPFILMLAYHLIKGEVSYATIFIFNFPIIFHIFSFIGFLFHSYCTRFSWLVLNQMIQLSKEQSFVRSLVRPESETK